MRFFAVAVPAAVLMFISTPVLASFGGCVISPKNPPTLIPGAMGAGVAVVPWLKARRHTAESSYDE